MRAPWIIAWVASIAGAFALGRAWSLEAPSPTPVAAAPARPIVVAPGRPGLTADEVRALLREERTATVATDLPQPPADDEPSPALDEARGVIDRSLAAGRWTETDRTQLKALLPALRQPEIDALFARLFPAINDGRLTTDLVPPI